jgi:uncharacterized protein (DUF1800 family)
VADPRAAIAHLLRRVTFGPAPGQVEALAPVGYQGAVEAVLQAPERDVTPPKLGTTDDSSTLAQWWLAQMADPAAGLHEKLTWFWHGHFTSSIEKIDNGPLMWRQHLLLRRHALGSFRELVREITIDGAMLLWLDGSGSSGDAPNENCARELMELFTMGRGSGYTEADVRAGAKALTGWTVDDNGAVSFDPSAAYPGSVTFLGRSGHLDAAAVADAVCDHPACAPWVTQQLFRFLVGINPTPSLRSSLAAGFRDSGLQLRPLVEQILRSAEFAASRWSRPRFPVEWMTAARLTLGTRPDDNDALYLLGQVPFAPPNVAGWPPGFRWIGVGPALVKASLATTWAADSELLTEDDPVGAALDRASLYDATSQTKNTLLAAARSTNDGRERSSLLLALAVCAPEFSLA